jgi:hypothetical protein
MAHVSNLKNLITSGAVDFGKMSSDYSTHRPGLPDSFFSKIENLMTPPHTNPWTFRGKNVLDIATGT